ncbi:MAG: hypothetical protein IEMM0002_0231 [bacterium]|nr:MAG: hypothetical protein IEMM0002_0231 [bacterium]
MVMVILGIFAAFVAPRIGDVGGAALNKNARKLAHVITYLYSQASAQNRMLRFTFNLETGKYYAAALNSSGAFEPVEHTLFSTGKLSDGISIVRFTTLFNGNFVGENVYFHLMPEGFAEKAVIILRDRKGRMLSLTVDPLTGRVSIDRVEGRIEFEAQAA